MKSKALIILQLVLFGYCSIFMAIAQRHRKWVFGHNILFERITTDTRMMVTQPSTLEISDTSLNDALSFGADKNERFRSPIMLGVKLNPTLTDFSSSDVKSISKDFATYVISDGSEATLLALGINTQNVKDYRYHVVENDSVEIVPWSPIARLEQKYGAKQPYGAIGTFKAPGKKLMIEVVNVKDYSIRDGVIFDWRKNFRPFVNQIIVETTRDITGGNKDYQGTPVQYFNLTYAKLNRGYASKFDSQTGLPLDLKFPVDSIGSMELNFKDHETIPYVFYLISHVNGKTDTASLDYWTLTNRYEFDAKHYNKPGKYELIVQRAQELGYWGNDQVIRMPFEVTAPPVLAKTISLKQLLPYVLGSVLLLGLLFTLYYQYNRRRLKNASQQKAFVNLQLKSIRAQLNPHFMFNALTSIQNLVNKNDMEAANNYLARFADLTRKVLDTAGSEMISIKDETDILNNYLQMEKLRFGFTYQIEVDPKINQDNTEIPAMLLQPFIENSVKHGVGALQSKGVIKVAIEQQGKNLILSVTDNGKGFDVAAYKKNVKGLGLKLSEERIAL